jgi:hypothetical protein
MLPEKSAQLSYYLQAARTWICEEACCAGEEPGADWKMPCKPAVKAENHGKHPSRSQQANQMKDPDYVFEET